MTDRELLQQMIDRIGKQPRAVEFDGHGHLVQLNLAGLDLEEVPAEVYSFEHLRILALGESFWHQRKMQRIGNRIHSLNHAIGQCLALEELCLDNNQIQSLPAVIADLPNLRVLKYENNSLGHVPPLVLTLTRLETLWLDANGIAELPDALSALADLRSLTLNDNQITLLPLEVVQLANLQTLSLYSNQLTSVPPELGQLANLQTLSLYSNQLTSVPRSLAGLARLDELDLKANPLRTPPPEVAEQGATAVRAYLSRLDDTSVIRNEAKLLLVGEGATGKSSLLRALRGQDYDGNLSTTHGVDILPISLPCPDRPGVNLTLHVWDFGGQQIYHTTHQFFMTRRSLYLLVWSARGEADQGRLDHWLRKIQVLAPGSPVLLVATHCDEHTPQLNLNRFRTAYPQIVGMAAVSNKTGAGIEELKAVIAAEAARLPLMEQEWPRVWVDVEQALQASDRPHIDGQEYTAICARCGVDAAFEQQVLGAYLHDLGKILYYQDDDTLSDFVVLKPNWLTQAMARVLDDDVTRDQRHGVLDHADFPRIWAGYDRHLFPVFLRMLERFLISYQLEEPEPGHKQSMVPQLLPHTAPAQLPPWADVLPDQPEVRMVFDLDFVPDGIMSWFIVLTHHYSQDLHWREGVRLHYDGHQADVVLNPSTRQLWLQVRGPAPSNFFTILQHTINDRIIRRYFEGLTYRRRMPCICHKSRGEAAPCTYYFDYDEIVERKQRGRPTKDCERTYEQVSVTELLEGIHYTTLDRLDETVDRMLDVIGKHTELLLQVRQLSEQSLREHTRMWNLLTKSLFNEAPSVFVIMPGDRRSYDLRGLFSEDYLLYLLCQHPAGPHIVAGEEGYRAPKDREWWRQVRPWLHQLSKILKFVPKLSGIAKLYDEQGERLVQLTLELSSTAFDLAPEPTAPTDRGGRRELESMLGTDVEPEGAALRALHVFLREVDKTQHWCGLKRVVTNDGNILWLCPEHAPFHEV